MKINKSYNKVVTFFGKCCFGVPHDAIIIKTLKRKRQNKKRKRKKTKKKSNVLNYLAWPRIGDKLLPDPMLTKISDASWRHELLNVMELQRNTIIEKYELTMIFVCANRQNFQHVINKYFVRSWFHENTTYALFHNLASGQCMSPLLFV